MRDLHPHQLAAVAPMQLAEQRFGLQRDRMCNEPRSRREARPDRIEHHAVEATADEDGIRRFQRSERFGRFPRDNDDPMRQSEGGCILTDVRDAILARLDGECRSAAQCPLDRD